MMVRHLRVSPSIFFRPLQNIKTIFASESRFIGSKKPVMFLECGLFAIVSRTGTGAVLQMLTIIQTHYP